VKQEVNGTVKVPSLVFPGSVNKEFQKEKLVNSKTIIGSPL
jgi:hypothetical protein